MELRLESIPSELVKMLKKIGLDIKQNGYEYIDKDTGHLYWVRYKTDIPKNVEYCTKYNCSLEFVKTWFRERHNVHINPISEEIYLNHGLTKYECQIHILKGSRYLLLPKRVEFSNIRLHNKGKGFDNYYEALKHGLKTACQLEYRIKKLIE